LTEPPARRRALRRGAPYVGVAALAAAALRFTPPVPTPTPAARLGADRPLAFTGPRWSEQTLTLGKGEALATLLERSGLPAASVLDALRASDAIPTRVPAGVTVTVGGLSTDSLPSQVVLRLASDRLVHLRRTAGGWEGRELRLPSRTDTVAVSGRITSTLYDALDGAEGELQRELRAELVWTVADIFEYRVDMSRDLQPGDSVGVLVERVTAPDGSARLGRVLAARFLLSGRALQAVRYTSTGAGGQYFDQDGKSLRAQFLRAPLAFRRVSSGFGMRRHPILGVWRAHKGTDYAARLGTPVRSIGDGVVIFAGRKSGSGNVVEVRHRNGYVTRYGHLRSFARGTRRGARVTIGQTIARVGMTGLATAPHLHFEVLVGGVQRDPRVALRNRSGEPIPARERGTFETVKTLLLASLGERADAVHLATLDGRRSGPLAPPTRRAD